MILTRGGIADPYGRPAWHETALTPQVDFVHSALTPVHFDDESHPRYTSAGQTIGKLQSHAVTQEMLAKVAEGNRLWMAPVAEAVAVAEGRRSETKPEVLRSEDHIRNWK